MGRARRGVWLTVVLASASAPLWGQGVPGRGPAAPRSARDSAQVDLTGSWVALVTEDWLWRMITPPRGDATSVPLNPAGQRDRKSIV